MFESTIAGSLPKPAWLAETGKLWPKWRAEGAELRQAKLDATLLWIKAQEDAGLDVIGDGEQSRQHFVHGFLEQVDGIDFEHKVEMGIRDDRYKAMVPQVVAPLRLKGRVHAFEAQLARAHTTRKLKFTLPGPMTIVDTVADRHYGDRVQLAFAFAELLNQEARALEADGIDFEHTVEMGIRDDRYKAMVPQVVGPLRLRGRVHADEARFLRAHTTRKIKFTLPGPMTIVDTVADRHYGDRVKMAFAFAELLNQEALALQADGVDIVQFDEPAFNAYIDQAADWGVQALERAAQGLACTTAVHICYGYGIQANIDWKNSLGAEWRQYERFFPALAASSIGQVSLEFIHSRVPPELMRLLAGKDVMVGVIDVASDQVETPEEVAETIGRALQFVARERLRPCTNCGLAPMSREVALAKLQALGRGVALARERF